MGSRIDTTLTGIAVCATLGLLLWPRAQDAGAVLAAQDDPVTLADVQVDVALKNDPGVLARNIEEALAARDADLANSFVEVAAAKNVVLPANLTNRVNNPVAKKNPARISPPSSPPGWSPAMPTTSPACRARWPATCSCSATSAT